MTLSAHNSAMKLPKYNYSWTSGSRKKSGHRSEGDLLMLAPTFQTDGGCLISENADF